jgi:hypothetical protein
MGGRVESGERQSASWCVAGVGGVTARTTAVGAVSVDDAAMRALRRAGDGVEGM